MKSKFFNSIFLLCLFVFHLNGFQGKQSVDILNQKAADFYKTSLDSFYVYTNSAYEKAKKINYVKGMALAQSRLGWVHKNMGKHDLAMENYIKALFLLKENKVEDYENLFSILHNMAVIYSDFKLYEQAISHYDSALVILDKYMNLQYDASLTRKKKDLLYFKAKVLINTGNEMQMQQGLEILQDIYDGNDTINGARTLNRLGLVLTDLEEYDKARKQFDMLFSHPKVPSRYKGMAYHNIGRTYLKQGELKLAEDYYSKAYDLNKQLKNKRTLFITMSDLGEVYIKQGRYTEAVNILEAALDTYDQVTRKPEYYTAYNLLATAYTRIDLSQYDKYNSLFLAADDAYIQQQQKLRDDARQKKILMTISGFMNHLKLQKEKRQFEKTYWTWGLVLLLVAGGVVVYYIRKDRKRKAALGELKQIFNEAEQLLIAK